MLDLRLDPDVVAMDRRRGHRFQPPKATLRKIPGLRATEGGARGEIVAHLHYFVGGWDWWVTELDPETFAAFGRVRSPDRPEGEWGYFDLAELATSSAGATINGVPFRQPVERDCWWDPTPVAALGTR